jgi:hypothetical protein
MVSIFGLDEDRMRTWWDTWQSDLTFRLFHRSCATTVASALATGQPRPADVAGQQPLDAVRRLGVRAADLLDATAPGRVT